MSINALKLRGIRTRAKKVIESAARHAMSNRPIDAEFIQLARLFEELVGELEAATLRGKAKRGEPYAPANTPANKAKRERLRDLPVIDRPEDTGS